MLLPTFLLAAIVTGYLNLSSLSGVNADADIDKTAYRIYNQLFGFGFYASFNLRFRRYYDSGLLNNIENVSGEDLVNEGVIMREFLYSATHVAANTSVVNQYRTVAENIGYNVTEIVSLINTNTSGYNTDLLRRITYYEVYATDSDTSCANFDKKYLQKTRNDVKRCRKSFDTDMLRSFENKKLRALYKFIVPIAIEKSYKLCK
ncbi:hypothetical protein PICMEDRAFT_10051 [Pichia membranifaciens NRRL Y-2026]|uniref:Uncharacterized protein n=1 Tax=Pichia membranifaciens NRRL Y-2026 TaxID=763406 RepID=A0A1E3NLL3_9ASCO|nr:hypothetical protein PICMEDRAFT_10051 [Pichia membranifaciens NRRL Y-2026]ODQ47010.1 hypothetical protein PICMEDRAFT_10051 [Pichia membranifaciens NRRL Y-2026]